MNHYLVLFDRSKGDVIRKHRYADRGDALNARFAAELEFRNERDIEVVVLGVSSWDALKRTHSRYFQGLRQLAFNPAADRSNPRPA